MSQLEDDRKFWRVAGTFPRNKEEVYPAHAQAHGFDLQAGKRVLEYGCGGGSDTISLLKRGADVFFVDIVPENVALTRQRVDEWIDVWRAESPVIRAPLTDDVLNREGWSPRAVGYVLEHSAVISVMPHHFDTITSHGVLHHIEAKVMDQVLREFFRVLKPGGHLYVMLYSEHLFERGRAIIEGVMEKSGYTEEQAFSNFTDGGGIARAYTVDLGQAVLECAGFELLSHELYNDNDFRVFHARKPRG